MPRLLEAAAEMGLRGVEAGGITKLETTAGHTVASCPGGEVGIGLDGERYVVSYRGTSLETPLPHTAVALAYNAFSQSLLEPHRARIVRILVEAGEEKLPRECNEWAGRILGKSLRHQPCSVAVALAGYASALYRSLAGDGSSKDNALAGGDDFPGLQESLGLARGVCRWPRACSVAKSIEEALSRVRALHHSRAGHLLASWITGYDSLVASAAAHHFTLLTGARSMRVRPGCNAVPVLAAVEAAWLVQGSVRWRIEDLPGRAMIALSYDAVAAPWRSVSWMPPTAEYCPGGYSRCRKPYISFSRLAGRMAASRALMDERGVYYEHKGSPVAYAVIHGSRGVSIVEIGSDPVGPWDAVLAAATASTEEGSVMGLLVREAGK